MNTSSRFLHSMMALLAVAGLLFPACTKTDEPGSQSSSQTDINTGKNNTRDMAVTGGVIETGMTYADLKGYVNIPADVVVQATSNGLYFRVGVWYGESRDAMNQREVGSRTDREFTVTVQNLKAGKTYFYQSFLEVGRYVYDEPVFETLGLGSETGTFTTKEVSFSGAVTADGARDISFYKAEISGRVDIGSLNKKETFRRGFVWSTDRNAVTSQFAAKLDEARYEDAPGELIELNTGQGRFVNGDLHFFVCDDSQVRLFSTPGAVLYYTPFLIISGKTFTGEPKELTMRSLSQTSGFVDLGLSCQWAATNIGTTSPWELGGTQKAGYTSDNLAKDYGSGQRIPTQEEINELNSRCSFEDIDNGVLITGPNGHQIFIPSQTLDEAFSSTISLLVNTYLTSSTKIKNELGGQSKYQVGYYNSHEGYFGTTDLPILSYPYNMNQKYYLRPVTAGGSGSGGGGGGETEDDVSKFIAEYVVNQFYLSNGQSEYDCFYDMEISRVSPGSRDVYIYNLWEGGQTLYGTVSSDGLAIEIPASQLLYVHSSYGDVVLYYYDKENPGYSNQGNILLKYDSYNNMLHSTDFAPFVPSASAVFGVFSVLMWHK